MRSRLSHLLIALAISLPACGAALAGSAAPEGKPVARPIDETPLTVLRLKSSYVFESDFQRGRDNSGDAWTNEIEVAHRFPLDLPSPSGGTGGWFLRLGAAYSRFDFNNSGDLPLPDTLQSVAAIIAIEYLQAGDVGILFETAPGFYFEEDIHSDAFDAPTKLAAAFPITDSFYLVGGVSYIGLRSYSWLPVAGLYWRISDKWTLRAIVPDPRLIYRPSDRFAVWIGGALAGGSFRTDADQERQPNLRRAVVSYSEWRAGAGFTYGDPYRCSLEVGAGYAFQRKFDYHRAEEGFETDGGAPYVELSLRAGF